MEKDCFGISSYFYIVWTPDLEPFSGAPHGPLAGVLREALLAEEHALQLDRLLTTEQCDGAAAIACRKRRFNEERSRVSADVCLTGVGVQG